VIDGIEANAPFPLVDIMRQAGALGDRADAGLALINVPAFLMSIWFAAAGDGGHDPLKRGTLGIRKPLGIAA
jgi:hypothetical protein